MMTKYLGEKVAKTKNKKVEIITTYYIFCDLLDNNRSVRCIRLEIITFFTYHKNMGVKGPYELYNNSQVL